MLPHPVLVAWEANQTLALLLFRDGGIDDRLVKDATGVLVRFPDAAVFVLPAAKISRYAAITEGVGVDRVPALVVTPKHPRLPSLRAGKASAHRVLISTSFLCKALS